jgi:hypothetical protein
MLYLVSEYVLGRRLTYPMIREGFSEIPVFYLIRYYFQQYIFHPFSKIKTKGPAGTD